MTHFCDTIRLLRPLCYGYTSCRINKTLSQYPFSIYTGIPTMNTCTPPMCWATYIQSSCSRRILLLNSQVDSAWTVWTMPTLYFWTAISRAWIYANALVCHTSLRLTSCCKDTIMASNYTSPFHALGLWFQRQEIACDLLHVSGLSLQLPRRRTDPSPCQVLVTRIDQWHSPAPESQVFGIPRLRPARMS